MDHMLEVLNAVTADRQTGGHNAVFTGRADV